MFFKNLKKALMISTLATVLSILLLLFDIRLKPIPNLATILILWLIYLIVCVIASFPYINKCIGEIVEQLRKIENRISKI